MNRSLTVLCWVHLSHSAVSAPLVSLGNVRLVVRNGLLVTYYTSEKSRSYEQILTPNQWYHVGSPYDSSNGDISLWVNGRRVDQETIEVKIDLAVEQHMRIGGMDISYSYRKRLSRE